MTIKMKTKTGTVILDCKGRLVEVERYRSEGFAPVRPSQCPMGEGSACVGGSGDTFCGGFMGLFETRGPEWAFVRCDEKLDGEDDPWIRRKD